MKYKIIVEERPKFSHEMVIDIPDNMEVDDVLDDAQDTTDCFSDLEYVFKKMGVNVIEMIEDSSGEPGEIEITDCYEFNDELDGQPVEIGE
jgi:hypothetical protein